jgi:hypothetical protein
MNESDLEKELRSLQPTNPSAQLAERIAAELKTPAARPHEPAAGILTKAAKQKNGARFASPWLLVFAGAAALVIGLFAVAIWMKPPSRPTLSNSEPEGAAVVLNETPDESVDELIDAKDEGVVYGEGEEPQRQVRMVYIERHTWTNSRTGAVVEFEVPREDVVLMPVAMQ